MSKTNFIIMSLAIKTAPLNSFNVGISELHNNLNNVIKNKKSNIAINNKTSAMDILECSTVADSSDLNNLDGLDNLGLCFNKTLEYKKKNKVYNINVYNVVDYDMFYNNALFNGWLLTSDEKYSCYCLDVPPFSWIAINTILKSC